MPGTSVSSGWRGSSLGAWAEVHRQAVQQEARRESHEAAELIASIFQSKVRTGTSLRHEILIRYLDDGSAKLRNHRVTEPMTFDVEPIPG
jgi:hypothetical protein